MVSQLLANFVAGLSFESLPKEVVHQFKRTLMDYFSVAILGSTTEVSKKVLEYLVSVDNNNSSSVVAQKKYLSPMNAALANGTSAHSLDFDDGHREGSIHPGGVVYPAVLAIGEAYGLTIKEIILGVVIGYDITIRLSMAMHPHALSRGFHNTPIAGVLGAAAAVSKMFALNKEQILNALGLAGSFAGGLFAFMQNGADVKRIHPGKAARDGVLCAELAKRGLTGPPEVIEGPNGFYQSHAGNADLNKLVSGLGEEYEIMNIYMKPYPACRHLHPFMDCVLKIKEKSNIVPEEIKLIKVGTYQVAFNHSHKTFNNLLETQMSIPCAVATTLYHHQITLDAFAPETFKQNRVLQQLVEKVEVYIDEECEKNYPNKRPAKVSINLNDGTIYSEKVDQPRGSNEIPLSDKEVEEKLLTYCSSVIGYKNCRKLIDRIWNIENLSDISPIFMGGTD